MDVRLILWGVVREEVKGRWEEDEWDVCGWVMKEYQQWVKCTWEIRREGWGVIESNV